MIYYFSVLSKLEKKNLLNILIDILCLSLGFLVAIIFISQAGAAYEDYVKNKANFALDHYFVCVPNGESSRMQKDDLDSLIYNSSNIENVLVYNRMNDEMVVFNESFCQEMTIYGITNQYEDIFNGTCLQGSSINNINDAVIGIKSSKKYGIGINDNISISNKTYKICGIISIPQYESSVLISSDSLETVEFYDCQYFIKTVTDDKSQVTDILELNYGFYDVYQGSEYIDLQRERLMTGWAFSIIIAIVTVCYGLINIYNIESFFVIQQKKEMAILRSIGASSNKILLVKIVRALLIAVISSSLTSFLVWILEHTKLTDLIDFKMNIFVYFVSTFIIMCIYAMFSFALYKMHYSKEIAKILSQN